MPRKVNISKKDDMENISEAINKQNEENPQPLVIKTGGCIYNLPETIHTKQWLDKIREKNPLIGTEFVQAAPELNVESIKLSESIIDLGELQLDELGIPVNDDNKDNTENLPLELIKDESDTLLIDFAIVQNTTKLLISSSKEEIKEKAIENIKKYHGNDHYEIEIDLDLAIDRSKVLILENNNNNKMLE